jgi:predicted lipid-binding transport protein (Tim44 family)
MAKSHTLAALIVAALLVLAPTLADARAGGSYRLGGSGSFSSMGSLGSRTYTQPMQRSVTPQSSPYGGQSGYGYGASHPFLSGLAGGFFGGWLGSMMFPHWGMGGYGMGFGGILGSIFSWFLIIGLVWLGFRMLTRRYGPVAAGAGGAQFLGAIGGMQSYGAAAPAMVGAPLAIAQVDYQAFETILQHVQAAWTSANLAELRRYVTPEMLSYFAEELAGNESQGVVNPVEQVELLRGDLREAWDEGRLHYATCYLSWRALDYSVRSDRGVNDSDYIASGDPHHPSEAAELWTFARSPGGHWLLSAIQQV